MAQKIIPNLWFNGVARTAAEFYVEAFANAGCDARVSNTTYYPSEGLADFQKGLEGKELTVSFKLDDMEFVAINAGPEFAPTAAISFLVNFDPSRDDQAVEHLDALWAMLQDGGEAIIEVGEHPFSKRYGWVRDKYGFSWQLMLTNPAGEPAPFIVIDFLFGGSAQNRGEEAMNFYASVFNDTSVNIVARYPADQPPVAKDGVMFGELKLEGQQFAVMDSAVDQADSFTEAISLAVFCRDQAEIDALWNALSAVPEAEQCGWCKDKFGVSWQIVPANIDALMTRPGAYEKLMEMKKIVIDEF